MRGALEPIPGVRKVNVKPGRKSFTVAFDPQRVTAEAMLEALRKAGEEAQGRPTRATPLATADPHPADAVKAVLEAFERIPLVALVEPDGLEQEHEFLGALIQSPGFASKANAIVVEFGNRLYQGLLDRYLAGEEIPRSDLRPLWQDSLYSPYLSWDAPAYERFFLNVRTVNQALPSTRRLRVIVAGAPIDWRKISNLEDLRRIRETFNAEEPHLAAAVEKEILARGWRALLIASRERLLRGYEKNDLARIEKLRPGSVLVVAPHLGLGERNGELEPRLSSWPRPSLAGLKGTWLGDVYEDEFTFAEVADEYLYLGPRDELTVSRPFPEIYRDDQYFAELDRRHRIQAGAAGQPLDRGKLMKGKPRKLSDSGY